MPDCPVIDSHQHFWDPSRRHYYWLGAEALAPLQRVVTPAELAPKLSENGVDGTILVQAAPSAEETVELLHTAATTDFVYGVVGWVDLCAPLVGETLADMKNGPNGDYLVGIRHQSVDEPDPNWLARDEVVAGIGAVGAAGLVYELLPNPSQILSCLPAVDAWPEMAFVVNHIAFPNVAAGVMEPWSERLAVLASRPRVFCKLSGLVTLGDWKNWKVDDLRPFVERVLELFGEDRVLFGSDWPVCELAADYSTMKTTLEDLLGGKADTNKVFGGTAAAVYGLCEE